MLAIESDTLRAAIFAANLNATVLNAPIDSPSFAPRHDLRALLRTEVDVALVTPPCQSFSTANPNRGRRFDIHSSASDARTSLFFSALNWLDVLKPKLIIFENVPNFFHRCLASPDGQLLGTVSNFVDSHLHEYIPYRTLVNMTDHGVPQRRIRSLGFYCRRDILKQPLQWTSGRHWLFPNNWKSTNSAASTITDITAGAALSDFPTLDASSVGSARDPHDPLHFVPTYDPVRYRWVADIPPGSGRSAYENSHCTQCGATNIPVDTMHCIFCGSPLLNRPHVKLPNGSYRLIHGFATSYRRIHPGFPAPTVTTASSHLGSSNTIHPFQNRVLSIRECARLQTVPHFFDWTAATDKRRYYAIRQILGEGIPSWFMYQLASRVKRLVT